ncbi:MAG: hypothetical protein MO852_11150 [Candidatus Devosia euplotis]|nr:hypothetical protein [Candidatus Devosia euplotis]
MRAIGALQFDWAGQNYRISASIGITPSPLVFIGEAAAACYAVKAQGRGGVKLFTDG